MILEEVRSSLLKEAKMSPNLLSDLAGLEHYIAESYHNRSFAELLQNADDADSTKFIIDIAENYILIANDGRYFNKKDFESLCRSTRSFKKRGEKIGYRGIGFKSVVGFSGKLHLLSGDIKTTFSKKLTKNEMSADINVPLIRIPHPMNNLDANVMKLVNKILNKGYKTIFIFENINKQQIETEIDNFNSSSLLFLNNINKIELNTEKNIEIIEAKRKIISPQISKSIISKGDKIKRWLTIGSETQESISFSLNVNGGINRLKDEESLVYAFLPTEEKTGLGIKINGDVSTDPSRRKVILDNNTQDVIRSVSKIISKLFIECLKNEFEIANEKEIINALLPYIDPRSIAYKKKTFSTELLKNIKKIINNELEDLILKPSWINSLDFEKIAKELNLWMVDRDIAGLNNLKNLLSYFGAKEINNNSIINNINKFNLSIRGYAEFISLLINKYVVREILIRDLSLDMKIWIGKDDNVYSLNEINKDNIMVNNEFIELILEKVSYAEYKSFISSIMEYNNLNLNSASKNTESRYDSL
ncbi:sacsin N-terminal ATP-binding-like domain-containing protein [Halanaerobium sp. ST460_2HS_T2]|uniref:sacsin N-terminal ATP-binding-like domain-containing protein n=1 Tax=Halanaerobium sp. ST460_2HS_T2 TaxID=2183914 RepID=UPI000DF41588|nr:hypothetical protein [Halanaerobium sp. ST460_2HS_T2]RCW60158.1 hypothetical protein DFR80_1081 [Halanaerobium sp. ST460_2HS_T2]